MPPRLWLQLRPLASLLCRFRAPRPRVIDLELTNRCNLSCRMCWFHGENKIADRHHDRELSTEEVLQVIDQAAQFGSVIYFGGAEPSLRPDFLEIIEYAKASGLVVSFTTNGTLLDSTRIEALVRLAVDQIALSVDGAEELHDSIRGRGAYRQVIRTMSAMSACKQRTGRSKPRIAINMTVSEGLARRLEETVRAIMSDTGGEADAYRIHHQWFVTRPELLAHQAATKRLLGCVSPGAAAHLIPGCQLSDATALADGIRTVERWPKVRSFPKLAGGELTRYYAESGPRPRWCRAPFSAMVIKPDGDVRFCPDEWIDDYSLGNVRSEALNAIWNNARARRFRSVIARHGCFPACKRCSFMYSV
jgi:radical SAM protein with 4Fe4S-binding SPASM domain